MSSPSPHITILTEDRYVAPRKSDPYMANLLLEDHLIREALESRGLKVDRRSWSEPRADWSKAGHLLFRSTWDYFERFQEFDQWLEAVKDQSPLINPYEVIRWNLDKHYLLDLSGAGVRIPPTRFIEKGDELSLAEHVASTSWEELILKPVVSGAARHTYRFRCTASARLEEQFRELISREAMMIQEFQDSVPERGELTFMLMGGRFTHAVLKKAKAGDFRVQDDFGGTVHPHVPDNSEIRFAEEVLAASGRDPLYARVDAIWDRNGELAVSELELIEPELWFRFHPAAADRLAETIFKRYF